MRQTLIIRIRTIVFVSRCPSPQRSLCCTSHHSAPSIINKQNSTHSTADLLGSPLIRMHAQQLRSGRREATLGNGSRCQGGSTVSHVAVNCNTRKFQGQDSQFSANKITKEKSRRTLVHIAIAAINYYQEHWERSSQARETREIEEKKYKQGSRSERGRNGTQINNTLRTHAPPVVPFIVVSKW